MNEFSIAKMNSDGNSTKVILYSLATLECDCVRMILVVFVFSSSVL